MRLLTLMVAATLPAGSAAAPAPTLLPQIPEAGAVIRSVAERPADKCRRPDFRPADRNGRTEFRRLNQLPDATAYMAVYRTVDGCELPMTVTEYRSGRR